MASSISVVIPTLNEAERIGIRLTELAHLPGIDEVLVVDGGSRDGTRAEVEQHANVRCIDALRGRASQLNAGAEASRGDILLFLHADVALPRDAVRRVHDTLALPKVVAGAFKTWHVDDRQRQRRTPWLHLADVRSRYTRVPYGDQALFLRRATFNQVGGFPAQPLMEDLEFSRRLARLGRIVTVDARVQVSGRRFLAAPLRHFLIMNSYPLLYSLGVPPKTLARWYQHIR